MVRNGRDPAPKFLQDDDFFCKFSCKGKPISNLQGEASFRLMYYGGATGSVPFMWESQPGTPKHAFNDNPPPPLTPPPSYQSSNPQAIHLQKKQSTNYKSIYRSIFPATNSKKSNGGSTTSPTFSSASSQSSSRSFPGTPSAAGAKLQTRSRSVAGFGQIHVDDDTFETDSPTSTLCFGSRTVDGRSAGKMKRLLNSIVGHAKVH